jgi:uncharacterized NAD(P)/FAD-binding protein YdhS
MTAPTLTIAVLGAGPRGVGVLERLAANLGELAPGSSLVVHLVDPHPPGAGRIWRTAQSPLLKLNSMARDVTMYTDESSVIDGPVRPGPSLIEWADAVRTGVVSDVVLDDPEVKREIADLAGDSFPSRRLQCEYLAWFYRRAVSSLDGRVVEHAASAVRVDDLASADGGQRVVLDTGAAIDADVVLYALGHSGADPDEEARALAAFARRHGLHYVPPAFTADSDTSALAAGEPVIVRGMGLAAVDLTVLLTEGRGGRFLRRDDGALHYRPSGREPRLLLGSRRGIPYHSKISSTLAAPPAPPRFFDAGIAAELEAGSDRISFRRDVWPLIASEMLWGYYHELFVGHPERVRVPWSQFSPLLERHVRTPAKLRAVVAAAVPDPIDRLDLAELDRPLSGERAPSRDHLQETVRDYIETDLYLRSAPQHSATLALFTSLLHALFALGSIVDSPKWSARSRAVELPEWTSYFSFIASGPPAHRLEELLALSRAGVVEFLGGDLAVQAHGSGVFVATSPTAPGSVSARALVDARLPRTSVRTSDNPALRSLIASGVGTEEVVSDAGFSGSSGLLVVDRADARVVSPGGVPHPRRFAVGPYTNAPFVGAFARPGTNAVSFRENDRVARAILRCVAETAAHADGRLAAAPAL